MTDINDLRYTINILERLKKISRKLNKLYTDDCNYGDTDKRHTKETKLENEAIDLAKEIGYGLYFQTDPRGCALYLIDSPMNNSNYNNGIALY